MRPPENSALILGAASQIAPFLSQHLAGLGYRGVTVSREPPPETPPLDPAFSWTSFDLAADRPWPQAWVEGAVLFSSVPLWLVPRHIPVLARHGLKQVVAFSSTSVLTKRESVSGADRRLAEHLQQAEAELASACHKQGIPYTILRPTLVYGSGRDHNISAIQRFIRRFGFFPVAGDARGLRQPVHADDLAIAAVRCLTAPGAHDRRLNLPGGETLTYRAMVERLFTDLGRRPRIVPIPASTIAAVSRLGRGAGRVGKACAMMLRMNEDLAFDASEAHEVLDYRPRGFLAPVPLMPVVPGP